MYAGYMREKCGKIRYRLETIGVRATVLTAETDKRTTGLLVSAPIPIPTNTGEYRPIPDTRYRYRSNPTDYIGSHRITPDQI